MTHATLEVVERMTCGVISLELTDYLVEVGTSLCEEHHCLFSIRFAAVEHRKPVCFLVCACQRDKESTSVPTQPARVASKLRSL